MSLLACLSVPFPAWHSRTFSPVTRVLSKLLPGPGTHQCFMCGPNVPACPRSNVPTSVKSLWTYFLLLRALNLALAPPYTSWCTIMTSYACVLWDCQLSVKPCLINLSLCFCPGTFRPVSTPGMRHVRPSCLYCVTNYSKAQLPKSVYSRGICGSGIWAGMEGMASLCSIVAEVSAGTFQGQKALCSWGTIRGLVHARG